MKPKSISLVAALVVFCCGSAFVVIFLNTPTAAQLQAEAPPRAAAIVLEPGPVGRYQISAYGTGTSHGCYLVDTTRGDMWYSQQGSKMRPVRK
jgi:hypothetical protein